MRKIAIELEVDNKTIRNAIKYDLRFKSYTITPKHLLTTAMKEKRVERCKKINTWFKKKASIVTIF
uniref:Transposase Tc1-like domain-containing protein n=1 Tax=Octopus bimaculoides TaxID=37653 RepID=A0A0L8FX29_OCTBM